jgi:L,D-peptidoglycan transpeptidase YkuD (ErfK/YbiS/YcfS/YnhG family)
MKRHTSIPQLAPQIVVRALSARATVGTITFGNLRFPCTLGRSGRRAGKREGDGATPCGRFELREAYYRRDRLIRPRTRLPLAPIHPWDGWCDEPSDRNYNRRVRHPYPASAEHLWRADRLYDVVVVMGYNDRPRTRGRGSAVFLHVADPAMKPTAGCIALSLPHLERLIAHASRATVVRVKI